MFSSIVTILSYKAQLKSIILFICLTKRIYNREMIKLHQMNCVNKKLFICFVTLAIFSSALFFSYNIPNLAYAASDDENDKVKDDNKQKGTMELKIKLNLNNIGQNAKTIKVISYVNGEAKEVYIDLAKEKSQAANNILIKTLQYDKSNDISSIGVKDQYFVCGYVSNRGIQQTQNIQNTEIPIFDCDEGNIVSTDKNSAKLFYALNKYNEGISVNKLNGNANNSAKEVKLHAKIPLYDKTDEVDQINVVGMVRGEYEVKTINAKEELQNLDDKSGNDILDIPFIFNRNTELGQVQIGDMFFICVTGEELAPPEHSHCEKRLVKSFDSGNQVFARKDSFFK